MIDLFDRASNQPPPLLLSGERTFIRPAQMDDWKDWASLRGQSRVFLQPWEPTWPDDALTRAAWQRRLRRHYDEWRNDLAYNLLAFRQEDGALVGGLSLTNVRRGVIQTGTLGYWCGQPFARQGHISAAVRLLLDHAFGALALHRVEAGCLPSNIPSRDLLRKVGLREEGLAKGYLRINGNWEDHLLFALTRNEWATLSTHQN